MKGKRKLELLQSAKNSGELKFAPSVRPSPSQERKMAELDELVVLGFLAKNSKSDVVSYTLAAKGYEALSKTGVGAAINWFGAVSRLLLVLISFVAGAMFTFFLSNVSPRLYCSHLPNSGVGILAPCELPYEGKTQ